MVFNLIVEILVTKGYMHATQTLVTREVDLNQVNA